MSLRNVVVILGTLTACAGDETTDTKTGTSDSGEPVDAGLPIAGSYVDEFGTTHTITEERWEQDSPYFSAAFAVTEYGEDWVVAQNDAGNGYFPELWSRFDWALGSDGHLRYCQTAYDAADEAAALATARADDADLETGCSGFAWTDLTP